MPPITPHRSSSNGHPFRVVVVGNGMVADRFVAELLEARDEAALSITVIGEERHPAYDRVALSSLFDGRTASDLHLTESGTWDAAASSPSAAFGSSRSTGRTVRAHER